MTFNELNLSAPLLRAIAEAGYETPSPSRPKPFRRCWKDGT